jgi:hypothetical protein
MTNFFAGFDKTLLLLVLMCVVGAYTFNSITTFDARSIHHDKHVNLQRIKVESKDFDHLSLPCIQTVVADLLAASKVDLLAPPSNIPVPSSSNNPVAAASNSSPEPVKHEYKDGFACTGAIIADHNLDKEECIKKCKSIQRCNCVTWLKKNPIKCRLETSAPNSADPSKYQAFGLSALANDPINTATNNVGELKQQLMAKGKLVNDLKAQVAMMKEKDQSVAPALRGKPNELDKNSPASKSPLMVLTSFFVGKKDPQRHKVVSATYNYMKNYLISIKYFMIDTVIFHDGIPDALIKEHESDHVKFAKSSPLEHRTTNDHRFFNYLDWIKQNKQPNQIVMMVDISDVYFFQDPHPYFRHHKKKLYLSPDVGTLANNGWLKKVYKDCYGKSTDGMDEQLRNAGVWGGHQNDVECVLKCIVREVTETTPKGRNCNMAVFNHCINEHKCATSDEIDHGEFINPFRRECDDPRHYIIHNKCSGWEHNTCIQVKDGKITRRKGNC